MLTQAGARAVAVPMQDLAQVRAAFTTVGEQLGDRQPQAAAPGDLDRQIAAVSARVCRLPAAQGRCLWSIARSAAYAAWSPPAQAVISTSYCAWREEKTSFQIWVPRYAKVAARSDRRAPAEVILDAIHTDPAGAAARKGTGAR